jgi:hypothetical protein
MSVPASGCPKGRPLTKDSSGRLELVVAPSVPELVRRDRDRREGRGGLAVQEAEALGELVRDQGAGGDVVDQHDEPDVAAGEAGRRAHRHVVGDDRDLGLQVHAPGFVRALDRVARSHEPVRGALVHERVGPEPLRQLGTARLPDQLDVGDVGGAVDPLVGARQGRGAGGLVERERVPGLAALQALGQPAQLRLGFGPALQRRLQRRGDPIGGHGPGEVAGDDDEAAVAARLEAGEPHRGSRRFGSKLRRRSDQQSA